MHLQEKLHYITFYLGVNVTQNVAQYPLHHVTYSTTKFEVTTSECLGGETLTDARTDGRTDDEPTSKEKSGHNKHQHCEWL